MKNSIARSLAAATLIFGLGAGAVIAVTPAASANERATEIVVAQDTSAVAARPLTATPSAVGALSIQAAPKTKVAVRAKNQKPVFVTTNASGTAQVKKLTPGVAYTVTSGSNRLIAVPENNVVPATALRVVTTEIPGQLELRWQHQATPAQGATSFNVTAVSLSDPQDRIEAQTSNNSLVLTDLDLDTRYEFAVTAQNTISSATPTKAVMSKSLRELQGSAPQPKSETKPVATEQPKITPMQPVTPAGPSTRTIYVCPDSFTEVGGLCQKETPYTYLTLSYTFHNETRVEACAGADCPGSYYRSYPVSEMAPHCPQGGTIHGSECAGWTESSRTVTYQVKDSTPAGYTDNGSTWIKKDAMPAGYTDNGSAWVQVTAKIAREIPA